MSARQVIGPLFRLYPRRAVQSLGLPQEKDECFLQVAAYEVSAKVGQEDRHDFCGERL